MFVRAKERYVLRLSFPVSQNSQKWFVVLYTSPNASLSPPQQVYTILATHSPFQPALQHKAYRNIRIYHIPKFELHQHQTGSHRHGAFTRSTGLDPNSQQTPQVHTVLKPKMLVRTSHRLP